MGEGNGYLDDALLERSLDVFSFFFFLFDLAWFVCPVRVCSVFSS